LSTASGIVQFLALSPAPGIDKLTIFMDLHT